MHTPAALRIPPEIQEIICSDKALSRRDRARLARVCKHWHAAADAAIWKHVGSLERLLRLMPKDAWTGASVRERRYHSVSYPETEPRDEYGMSMLHCVVSTHSTMDTENHLLTASAASLAPTHG